MNIAKVNQFFELQTACNFEIDKFGTIITPGLADELMDITDSLNSEEIDYIIELTKENLEMFGYAKH